MEVTKGRLNNAPQTDKQSAKVAPFSVKPPAGLSSGSSAMKPAFSPSPRVEFHDADAFGKTVAMGFTANLQFCTMECKTCHRPPVGNFTHHLVMRVTEAGLPGYVMIAGGKMIADLYIVGADQLHHEKYVVMGDTKEKKVLFILKCVF